MGTRQKFQVIAVCGLLLVGLGCQPPGARAMFEGEARLKAGEPKQAVAQFEQAVKLLPGEWRAWNYLGLARHRAGDLDGAHEAFQRAMEMAGDRRNSPEDAAFVLKFNTGRLAIDRERLADAKTELHAYSVSAEPSFHAYFWLGEVYRKEMNWASASTEYQKALAQDDRSAVAHNRLGMAQLWMIQPSEAAKSFEAALKRNPDFVQAHLNLAMTYQWYLPGNDAKALEAFQQYLQLTREPAPGVQALADALQAKVRPNPAPVPLIVETNQLTAVWSPQGTNAAITNLVIEIPPATNAVPTNLVVEVPSPTNTVVEIPPATNKPPLRVTQVRPSLTNRPPVEVTVPPVTPTNRPPVKIAKTTVTQPSVAPETTKKTEVKAVPGVVRYRYVKPKRPEPGAVVDPEGLTKMFEKALHQHRINELDAAIDGYRKVLQVNPAYQQAYVNIALALQVQGEVKQALPVYEKALAINPFSKVTRHGFASALSRSEYYVDAAKEFHGLLDLYKNDLSAHLALGGLYSDHLKDPDKASVHFRKVLELSPQHPQATGIRQWLFNHSQR
ncbi:MAG: tetratricopeptide repeat protein [Limisphaerales bacterium]